MKSKFWKDNMIKYMFNSLNINTFFFVAVLGLYSLEIFGMTVKTEKSINDFVVTATLDCERGCEVVFELKNASGADLSFARGVLYRSNMTLLVVREGFSSAVLEEVVAIEDEPAGEFILASNEAINRTYDLTKMFPKIENERSLRNLIVFWSINLTTSRHMVSHQNFGGYIPIAF